MLKTTLKITALSAVSLTLIACGSGGNDNLDPPSSPAAAVADRVVSVRLVGPFNNGGTFFRDGEISVSEAEGTRRYLDDSYDLKISETQDTFALVQSGANLIMTVNGTAYTFTPEETSAAVRDPNDNSRIITPARYGWNAVADGDLSGFSNDLRTVLNGTHPTIQGDYVEYSTGPRFDRAVNETIDYTGGFATVGIQTPASVVASQTATATYTGRVQLNGQGGFTKTAGIDDYVDPLVYPDEFQFSYLDGQLIMTANFTNNTIAGEQKYRVATLGSNEPIAGREATLTFNPAPIVGNGFAGTFTMNTDYQRFRGLTSNNPAGNHYAGNFFGPNADDIAGVMRFDGQAGVIGTGGFRADRDVDPAQ